ncbi:unnamed protein product [Callosobruchus maculatus]|uniref:Uncharacterized protein n=1 Tax=Callosobruchus maculatus TaxID=64391 RepID=A0A653D7Q1_CALMS|nr:unnamed protein product [Callosobruchus maculatus]
MANLVLDMPCVKAAVPRRDVFLNPNDQMRRNLYLNTLLKIYQTLLLRHRQGDASIIEKLPATNKG